jgi:hypothetical protein
LHKDRAPGSSRVRIGNAAPAVPVAQCFAIDLPAFVHRSQQPTVFDARRGHPGVDPLLDPDRDGDGADAPAFALKVGQDPPSLALLDGLDVELGQLVLPQGAADQQRQDDVVAFALEG